jgi:S1-C subfamily serine protease
MVLILATLALGATNDGSSPWDATLETVTRGVVAIKMDIPRAFDGKGRSNSQATGFVIDHEAGLILTNRHVVTPGPVKAKAIFYDQEEVALTPVYRDPVHDFGLYRYDPAELEHMVPPDLPLSPERARVGLDIRVVGNDAGQQLQILDGTLARLDREAPNYGWGFNDFNTFYYQAASATSGGSSGSPVVDIDGHVVALNAGGGGKTASFYLPLDRVVRAVDLLEKGEAVPRGTLQTTVVQATYDELARMGVADEVLDAARERDDDATGLLVARIVLPGGPADGALEVGDVVLKVGDAWVHDHVTLEGALDDHVGDELVLQVARGPEVVEAKVTVGDLHAITPDRFLEMGGGVLHPLSYHQARVMQTRIRGISVAEEGYVLERAGVPKNAVITEIDGREVASLEALDAALAPLKHREPFRIRYYERGRPQETFVATARMDREWFDQRLCVRDDATGSWPCTISEVATGTYEPKPVAVTRPPVDGKLAQRLQPSLVRLEVGLPYQVAGTPGDAYTGVGVVVGEGLLVTDRDTVPEPLADVDLVVGGVARLPAKVEAVHPVHNLAVLSFDPSLLEGVGLQPVTWTDEPFATGDDLFYVGLGRDGRIKVRDGEVQGLDPLLLPDDGSPRFRQAGLDAITVHPSPPGEPGVLVDKKGRVGGLWASFSYTQGRDTKATWRGLPQGPVKEAIALAKGSKQGRALPWELSLVPLDKVLERGVPSAEAERLLSADPEHRFALVVYRVMPDSALSDKVRPGDLLLAVDGRPVSRFSAAEAALQGRDEATLRLWRGDEAIEVEVAPQPLDPAGVDRVVLWNGLRLHAAHRSARLQGMSDCPYVSYRSSGGPGSRAGIYAWRCIVAVNGTPTPDLDAFLAADAELEDGQAVRVDLVTLEGRREVRTLELHRGFWPTVELVYDEGRWERRRR